MSSYRPVFIDGPWKGRTDVPIDHGQRAHGLYVMDPVALRLIDYSEGIPVTSMGPPPLLYRFSEVAMFGRVVVVGSVAMPPKPDDLFAALASERAKAVSRPR